jgi:hypothetical protein
MSCGRGREEGNAFFLEGPTANMTEHEGRPAGKWRKGREADSVGSLLQLCHILTCYLSQARPANSVGAIVIRYCDLTQLTFLTIEWWFGSRRQ